jgi:hypothetical protein
MALPHKLPPPLSDYNKKVTVTFGQAGATHEKGHHPV